MRSGAGATRQVSKTRPLVLHKKSAWLKLPHLQKNLNRLAQDLKSKSEQKPCEGQIEQWPFTAPKKSWSGAGKAVSEGLINKKVVEG